MGVVICTSLFSSSKGLVSALAGRWRQGDVKPSLSCVKPVCNFLPSRIECDTYYDTMFYGEPPLPSAQHKHTQ